MDNLDLNLLPALDALLTEVSVTGAARRLGLSPSAMSRTLARLRSATGDPLLVRAGRGLVPTPRAAELRDRVHELAREARAVLSPQAGQFEIATLERTFAIRANEGFIALFSAPLVAPLPTRRQGSACGSHLNLSRMPRRSEKGRSILKLAFSESLRRRCAPTSSSATNSWV